MGLFLESWLSELLAVTLVAAAALYAWISHRYTYWTRRGIPQAEPTFPFGNIRENVLGKNRLEFVVDDIYNKYKDKSVAGMYGFLTPALVLIDPDIIRLVMVKDFASFPDRNFKLSGEEPASENLFNLTGNKWKRLRVKLTPTFTTGKLKQMCEIMQVCGQEMVDVLREPARRREVLEMREVLARYTTDIIASVAFGVECGCQRNPDSELRRWGRKAFDVSLKDRVVQMLHSFLPALAKTLRLRTNSDESFHYFYQVIKDTVEYRESKNVTRNDLMQLLIQLKNKGVVDGDKENQQGEGSNWKLSMDLLVAQAFLFFIAGFETSSSTSSFALYELALNPDVQKRLQKELDETLQRCEGKLTYDSIMSMRYLDMVVSETLRKYPPGAIIDRKCVSRYQLPNDGPVIEEGTVLFLPIYSLHHDERHFPDPERYDPERFSEEQKASRHPFSYIPFGEGPRICIGMRMGLLQSKIGLAYMLSKYNVERCEETEVPIEYSISSGTLMPTTGVRLRLTERA